jgi:hypothetical protein
MTANNTESIAETWRRRTLQRGRVDFTMMYVAHDAFNRDLARLLRAAGEGHAHTPEARATWANFSHQLHTHHDTEDTSLWPRLRSAVTGDDEMATLDAMEAEHETLDPLIERIDKSLHLGHDTAVVSELTQLAVGLAAHMRHEEDAALPLVERRLGAAGWARFGQDIRKANGGIRAGAQYLPWVLDGAPEPARRSALGVLPPPVRVLYRRVWEPKYRASTHLS